MKFLCLCYYDQKKYDAMTPADAEAIDRECKPRDAALHASGHLALVGSLGLPSAAKTIRPGTDKPEISTGPYAESSEPIGAFFIVEAAHLDEAVAVAALHPGAHLGKYLGGGIEVRPCDSFEQL